MRDTRKRKIKLLSWFERLCSLHLPHSSLRRTLVMGVSWSVVGEIVLRGLSLLAGIIVARLLGKHVYGQWGVILGIASVFGSLGGLGMATAAAKYVAELKKNDVPRAGRILSLILLVGMVGLSVTSITCLCLAKLVAYRLYNAPELSVPLMVASIMLFCIMGTLILQGVLAGFEDFREIARISMIQGVVLFATLVLLTYWLGLVGAVMGMAISQGTAMCLYLVAIFKQCREYGIRISRIDMCKELRIIWHYAAPGFLTSSVMHPANMLSQAMVANTQGGFGGLGGYNAAAYWRELVLFIPRAAKRITLPMLSKLKGDNDYKRFRKALWANIAVNGGIALAVALPLMILSPWILRLYGPDFAQDWDIFVVVVAIGVLQAIRGVFSQLLACLERMWYHFAFHFLWGIIVLSGSYIMIPKFGVRGFIWSYAFATLVTTINISCSAMIFVNRFSRSKNE